MDTWAIVKIVLIALATIAVVRIAIGVVALAVIGLVDVGYTAWRQIVADHRKVPRARKMSSEEAAECARRRAFGYDA